MAAEPVVLSHWHRLIEDFETSPLEFYQSVEQAVERRALPDAERSRVDYFEGGAFSAKREYLRIRRQRLVLDISGGPFGTGFFVSWWLGELRAGPWMLLGILAGLFMLSAFAFNIGIFVGLVFVFLGIPAILLILARNPPEGLAGWDDPLVSIPVLGAVYQAWFRPLTRYKVDATLAFQESVHAAVLEVVDQVTVAQGLRALSDSERRPVLREFFQR